jgi:hypothetical protein
MHFMGGDKVTQSHDRVFFETALKVVCKEIFTYEGNTLFKAED